MGELTIHGPERRHEALKDINRLNESLITTVVDFAKEHGLPGITEKVAYHGTSLVLDTALINKAATALNKFATVANASMAEVAHEFANAATKAPALEAITAEGIAVKVPQSTEICALSEAQEGIKQSGKINNAHKAIKNSSLKENIEKYINKLEIYRKKFQKFNIEIYKDQIKHIANSHYPNGARFVHNLENNGIRASTFFENENFLDIALETLECETKS